MVSEVSEVLEVSEVVEGLWRGCEWVAEVSEVSEVCEHVDAILGDSPVYTPSPVPRCLC